LLGRDIAEVLAMFGKVFFEQVLGAKSASARDGGDSAQEEAEDARKRPARESRLVPIALQ
jgi:hypothetical protein